MIDLEGKVAIVTGAAHGIGRAIAEVFAEAGSNVVIADVEDAPWCEGLSLSGKGSVKFVRCDVSVQSDMRKVIDAAGAINGRIDVLCNNAAYVGPGHAAAISTDEEWERGYRVSLLGTQRFIAATLPFMIDQGSGSIINIASVQGLVGGRDSAAYTAMKHAVIGLTRSAAYDYGPQNIRVNALCPGAIRTRISPNPGEELHRRQISKTFLGRTGTPREVAYAALFLASDAASYVTGAAIPVDGGWTAM